MFRPRRLALSPRRGITLLVVLALLTLFAIVGLSLVLYADAAAPSARLQREAENPHAADMDPDLLFSLFLGQLIYDVNDDAAGVTSALRGHTLACLMYVSNGVQLHGQPCNRVR